MKAVSYFLVFFCTIFSPLLYPIESSCLKNNAYDHNITTIASAQKYHDSGHYDHDVKTVAGKAMQFIKNRIKKKRKQEELAIVFDIDETILSNYSHMEKRHFIATQAQLKKEIAMANDPTIKPILSLYNEAIKNHIAVFFVTGRRPFQRHATIKNFRREGIRYWSGLYFKPTNYHERSAAPFKSHAREAIEKKGYTVIASIGDQCSDLAGGYAEKTF